MKTNNNDTGSLLIPVSFKVGDTIRIKGENKTRTITYKMGNHACTKGQGAFPVGEVEFTLNGTVESTPVTETAEEKENREMKAILAAAEAAEAAEQEAKEQAERLAKIAEENKALRATLLAKGLIKAPTAEVKQ